MGCSTASTKDNSNIKSTLVALNPQTEPSCININPNKITNREISKKLLLVKVSTKKQIKHLLNITK